jgi:hypothetical protein
VKASGLPKNTSVAASQAMKEAAPPVIKIFFVGTSLELSIYVLASGAFPQPRHFVSCDTVEKTPSGRFFAKTTVNEPGTRRRTMS